jgi:hypothetical protein
VRVVFIRQWLEMNIDRRIIALVAGCSILIIGGLILVPSLVHEPTSEIRWYVQESDTYEYFVQVTGYKIESGDQYPVPFASLNHSHLKIQITSLPNIDLENETSFLENVIEFQKASCINQDSTNEQKQLTVIVSKCILPIGAWDQIDTFYPSLISFENESVYQTYFSEIQGELFIIGHRRSLVNSDRMWSALVEQSTGVPHLITYWNYADYCCGEYNYTVTLERIPALPVS